MIQINFNKPEETIEEINTSFNNELYVHSPVELENWYNFINIGEMPFFTSPTAAMRVPGRFLYKVVIVGMMDDNTVKVDVLRSYTDKARLGYLIRNRKTVPLKEIVSITGLTYNLPLPQTHILAKGESHYYSPTDWKLKILKCEEEYFIIKKEN